VPGGSLVFSVSTRFSRLPRLQGWSVDAAGRKTWPLYGYLDEGPRTTDWLTKGVVKQHRTMATYVNLLLRLGFTLSHVEEWGPTTEQIAARPNLPTSTSARRSCWWRRGAEKSRKQRSVLPIRRYARRSLNSGAWP